MDQKRPKLTKWTKLDCMGPKWTEVYLIGSNGIKVDLIEPNSNCLIFWRTNYVQKKILDNKLYIILQLQNNFYSHASHGLATSAPSSFAH